MCFFLAWGFHSCCGFFDEAKLRDPTARSIKYSVEILRLRVKSEMRLEKGSAFEFRRKIIVKPNPLMVWLMVTKVQFRFLI